MFLCLVYCSEKNLKNEIMRILDGTMGIQVKYFSDLGILQEALNESLPFLIIIAEAKGVPSLLLQGIYSKYPQVYFVYYHPLLQLDTRGYNDFAIFKHIIAGDDREKRLAATIHDLLNNFWKKIPYEKMGFSYQTLSARIKRVMNFIETRDLKQCLTAVIARELEISQGYLSQEFKKETGLSFREFMQKLMDHYERIVFEQLKLSAKAASQLLGYSELSSFSRSFKKRKGYPPSQRKLQNIYSR